MTTATIAIGTFTRKTHRHENVSISQPPRNGPTAPEIPARPDQAPMARAAIGVVERRADDREAAGNEQRAGRALHGAAMASTVRIGREPARDARDR